MTWHEQAWVEDHSPYSGGAYATHLIIAGIVNPDHDFEVFIHRTELAKRCHTSVATLRRQLDQMVEDSWLELLDPGGGRGNVARYKFLKKGAHSEQVSPEKGAQNLMETCSQLSTNNGSDLLSLTKEEQKNARDDPLYRFEDFWKAYPKRNGAKVEKAKARDVWRKMPFNDKAAAWRSVRHYGPYCDAGHTLAKDAHRWLSGKLWTDWQEPATPVSSNGHGPLFVGAGGTEVYA
jgi:hypothetical protein